MKKYTSFVTVLLAGSVLFTLGCASAPQAPASATAAAQTAPSVMGTEQILPYVHIDGFGSPTDTVAWIAWEFEAQAYVKYQIAYTSCTCRPDSINKRSLLYVEIAKGEKGGKIRKLFFDYWGDSPKMPSGVTRAEIEEGFVPLLANKKLDTIGAIDTMSGATVTTVNLKQITSALLTYHNAKYPSVGMPEPEDYVDATTAATE